MGSGERGCSSVARVRPDSFLLPCHQLDEDHDADVDGDDDDAVGGEDDDDGGHMAAQNHEFDWIDYGDEKENYCDDDQDDGEDEDDDEYNNDDDENGDAGQWQPITGQSAS